MVVGSGSSSTTEVIVRRGAFTYVDEISTYVKKHDRIKENGWNFHP